MNLTRLLLIAILLQNLILIGNIWRHSEQRADKKHIASSEEQILLHIAELHREIRALQQQLQTLSALQTNSGAPQVTSSQNVPQKKSPQHAQNKTPAKPIARHAPGGIENETALEESHTIVSGAIAKTRWQHTDTQALIKLSPYLTPTQREQILNQIADAVNQQSLKLDAPLPPF